MRWTDSLSYVDTQYVGFTGGDGGVLVEYACKAASKTKKNIEASQTGGPQLARPAISTSERNETIADIRGQVNQTALKVRPYTDERSEVSLSNTTQTSTFKVTSVTKQLVTESATVSDNEKNDRFKQASTSTTKKQTK